MSVTRHPRRDEVVDLYVHGQTIRQIAVRLGISVKGVEAHLFVVRQERDCASVRDLIITYWQERVAALERQLGERDECIPASIERLASRQRRAG